MSRNAHICHLPETDISVFPRLPPNAFWGKRLIRRIRKFTALNPNNARCKEFYMNKSSQMLEAKNHARGPYYYIIHPFSDCYSLIQVLFSVCWLYSFVTDPLTVFEQFGKSNVYEDMIDTFFIRPTQRVLIFTFFFCGYIDEKSKQIVIKPKKIALRYLRTYFIFDMIATQVITFPITSNSHSVLEEPHIVRSVTRIVEICCYYARFCTLLHYVRSISQHLMLHKAIQHIIYNITKMSLILHLIACMLYAVPKAVYVDEWPKESWLVQANIQLNSDTAFIQKYLECLLLAICYFFGANHTMYEIVLPNEQLCLSIVTLFGRLYTLFLLADLLRLFGIANVAESTYEQQLSRLDEYITSKKLPDHLRTKLVKFYESKLQRHCFNEPDILATLSEPLRTELNLFAARNLIRRLNLFRVLPKAMLGQLISLMELKYFSPKDVIIKFGEKVTEVFFISSGTVSVLNKDRIELCHLEDSDEFGIISIATEGIQMYQIEAVEYTEIFQIDRHTFLKFLVGYTEILEKMDEMVKKRIEKLQLIQKQVGKGGSTFFSALRSGQVLEPLTKRPEICE